MKRIEITCDDVKYRDWKDFAREHDKLVSLMAHVISMPFTELPFLINHENNIVKTIATERLKWSVVSDPTVYVYHLPTGYKVIASVLVE